MSSSATNKLDANNFFNSGRPKPPYRQNQFGATFGGPVIKDRMFFFGSYEGFRIREKLTRTSVVPTPTQIGGDFGGVADIYDSATQTGGRQPHAIRQQRYPGKPHGPHRIPPD